MHNHDFWGRHFRRVFIPHLRRLLEVLEVRFLPTLGSIEGEASALKEKAYQDLCEMPCDGSGDLSELAEAAQDLAFEFYSGMTSVQQAVLNAYAPILHRTWEQQLRLRKSCCNAAFAHYPQECSVLVPVDALGHSAAPVEAAKKLYLVNRYLKTRYRSHP
jgi:hypothetical protein